MAVKGFTLLELLVVLALFALALLVVPPMFSSGAPQVELKSTARVFASQLRRARSQAIARNAEVTFELDVEGRRYRLVGDGATGTVPEGLTLSLVTAESERIGSSRGSIRFYPDGSSTGGRITLGRGERSYLVDVDWLTGRVTLGE